MNMIQIVYYTILVVGSTTALMWALGGLIGVIIFTIFDVLNPKDRITPVFELELEIYTNRFAIGAAILTLIYWVIFGLREYVVPWVLSLAGNHPSP